MALKAKASNAIPQQLASIGPDIGENIFHIVGFDLDGQVVLRRKFRRLALESEFAKLPRYVVAMEACLSAHFVSRRLQALEFEPRIIAKSSV